MSAAHGRAPSVVRQCSVQTSTLPTTCPDSTGDPKIPDHPPTLRKRPNNSHPCAVPTSPVPSGPLSPRERVRVRALRHIPPPPVPTSFLPPSRGRCHEVTEGVRPTASQSTLPQSHLPPRPLPLRCPALDAGPSPRSPSTAPHSPSPQPSPNPHTICRTYVPLKERPST